MSKSNGRLSGRVAWGRVASPDAGAGRSVLRKNWRRRLAPVLQAVQVGQMARDMGVHEPMYLDGQAVVRLVSRAARMARERGMGLPAMPDKPPAMQGKAPPMQDKGKGAPPWAKEKGGKEPPPAEDDAPPAREPDSSAASENEGKEKKKPFGKAAGAFGSPELLLLKRAPANLRDTFEGLPDEAKAEILMAGVHLLEELAELDARLEALPLEKRAGAVRAWLREGDEDLKKFWGLAAQGATAAGSWLGRMGAARGIGMLGPRLARLFGRAPSPAGPITARASARATQPGLGLQDTRPGAMRAMGAVGRGARAVGRHAWNNRGGYGLSAGFEVGRRWGAEPPPPPPGPEQPRQPRQPR